MHVFGTWKEVGAPRENPHGHETNFTQKDTQLAHGFKPRLFLLWSDRANHYTSMPHASGIKPGTHWHPQNCSSFDMLLGGGSAFNLVFSRTCIFLLVKVWWLILLGMLSWQCVLNHCLVAWSKTSQFVLGAGAAGVEAGEVVKPAELVKAEDSLWRPSRRPATKGKHQRGSDRRLAKNTQTKVEVWTEARARDLAMGQIQ